MIKRYRKIISGIIFLLIFYMIYNLIVPVFEDKSTEKLSKEFYEYPRNTFDVLFLGSSVMMNAVYPLQLYDEYGIASYNLSCGSQRLSSSYYILKQAIRRQNPKLVVLDVYLCGIEEEAVPEGHTHYVTDVLHYPEKLEMILDVLPANRWIDFIFEMGTYHDRWESLTKADISEGSLYRTGTYGAKLHYWHDDFDSFGQITHDKKNLPTEQEAYLRKIIELCKKNDIDIMLTLMPLDYSAQAGDIKRDEWQKYWNKVQDIADEYGVNYLNFMYHSDELGLDLRTDTDGGTHLNGWGATKLTKYIGNYIVEKYEIPDVRTDSSYDFMKEDLLIFNKHSDMLKLRDQYELEAYLRELKKKKNNYTVIFSVKDIQGFYLNRNIIEQLKELGFKDADILLEQKYHSFIGIAGLDGGNIELYGGDEYIQYSDKINGREILITSSTLNTGNNSCIQIGLTNYSINQRGLNIVVTDKQTGDIVDSVCFDTHVPEFTCYR